MLRKLLLLPLFLATLASPAAATLLEVTVTGTIDAGHDLDGSVFGLGPNGNPAGLPVTIVFLIDTTKAPADAFSHTSNGLYSSQLASPDPSRDYIQTSWTINGISRASFAPNAAQLDFVGVFDTTLAGGVDSYTIGDASYDTTGNTNDRLFYARLDAILGPDLTAGDVLEQPFTSLNGNANAQSCGAGCFGFWEDHTNGKNEVAEWHLLNTGISVSYRVAPVPEPAAALMLGAGALALALRRKN